MVAQQKVLVWLLYVLYVVSILGAEQDALGPTELATRIAGEDIDALNELCKTLVNSLVLHNENRILQGGKGDDQAVDAESLHKLCNSSDETAKDAPVDAP